jgi:hypothetical protein
MKVTALTRTFAITGVFIIRGTRTITATTRTIITIALATFGNFHRYKIYFLSFPAGGVVTPSTGSSGH